MKHSWLLVVLLFINCSTTCKKEDFNPKDNKNELLTDALILDGRPFVGSQGKAYRRDEATLITYIRCDFNPDAIVRWHSLEGIEQLVNLKGLAIDGENFNKVDFSPLLSLSNLESLYFYGENFAEANFSHLSSLPNLESLRFYGITHLPDLTMLEQVSDISIRDGKLESLEGIGAPNARNIEIHNRNEIVLLTPLNNLLFLEKLVINSFGRTEYRIADILNLPSLKDLYISTGNNIDLRGIENMAALEKMSLDINAFNIEGVGKLENLRRLSLIIVSPKPSLEFLRDMPNLYYLYLDPNNTSIDAYNFEPYQVLDVSPLATVKNLRQLICTGFIIKNISTLDALDALSIKSNENPGYIYLPGCRLYDETETSRHSLDLSYPAK